MLEQPDVRPVKENGKRYKLYQNYTYENIVVPHGFQYDGASVPRIFMFLIGFERDGIHRCAALVHDWLYRNGGKIENVADNSVTTYTRRYADHTFYVMLKKVGVKSWHAKAAYWAVRLGGRFSWGK